MQFSIKNKKIIISLIVIVVAGGTGVIWLKLRKTPRGKATVEIGRTVENRPVTIDYDLKYSFKDYTNRNLLDAKDLNGKTIYATVFMQEIPDSRIFPEGMKGVTFVNCNLDNVIVPEGNTVIDGSRKRFKVQNDLRDWLIDENNKPIEPLNKEYWMEQGYSVDPKDIPRQPLKDISEIKKAK